MTLDGIIATMFWPVVLTVLAVWGIGAAWRWWKRRPSKS